MALPVVDPLPDPPIRGTDTGAVFSAKTAAFLEALQPWTDELNALAVAIVLQNSAANFSSTSTTSITIGAGSKAFTVQSSKLYLPGQWLNIASLANPTTRVMYGPITSYDVNTGALVVDVQSIIGGGAVAADWQITPSGPIGPSSGTSLTNPVVTGSLVEDTYAVIDGASVNLDPQNGSIQFWTLGASRTPTATPWAEGASITIHINDGTAYSVNWTTIGVVWAGGVAPVLPTTGYGIIVLSKAGGVIRGFYVGATAS